MRIKKYKAKTVQDAMLEMLEMRRDLGDKAVVLNTRTVKQGGLLKHFKAPEVEITAAYDETEEIEDTTSETMEEIKQELMDLKILLEKIPGKNLEKDELHRNLKKYHRVLVSNGVDQNISFTILKSIEEEKIDLDDTMNLEKRIKFKLREILGIVEPIYVGDRQKTVFFVGPTGVGKTTTLAKLASNLVMEKKYNIGLITSDTYRVGAVDQLKIYSDILDIDLEVAYNEKDIKDSFHKMTDRDIILVDTAGRNHNSKEQREDLKSLLESREEDRDIFLLVSAATDIKSLENLVLKYDFLGDYKLIVTKLDEVSNYGNLFNIAYIFDREIPYYTMGQNVPEDINLLDVDSLVENLIKERSYGSS